MGWPLAWVFPVPRVQAFFDLPGVFLGLGFPGLQTQDPAQVYDKKVKEELEMGLCKKFDRPSSPKDKLPSHVSVFFLGRRRLSSFSEEANYPTFDRSEHWPTQNPSPIQRKNLQDRPTYQNYR